MTNNIEAAAAMREKAARTAEEYGTSNRGQSMNGFGESVFDNVIQRDYALAVAIRAIPLPDFGITLFMIAFTALPWIGGVIGIDAVKATPFMWIFNAALLVFCVASFFQLREINASSTGFASIFALLWEWLSVLVGATAALAFWAVKGEQVRHMLEDDGDGNMNRNRKENSPDYH